MISSTINQLWLLFLVVTQTPLFGSLWQYFYGSGCGPNIELYFLALTTFFSSSYFTLLFTRSEYRFIFIRSNSSLSIIIIYVFSFLITTPDLTYIFYNHNSIIFFLLLSSPYEVLYSSIWKIYILYYYILSLIWPAQTSYFLELLNTSAI